MDRNIDREEENEPAPAESVPFRARLKVVAHYALLASPVLGLLGILLAIIALVIHRPAPALPDDAQARIESLNASLAETKSELESLKFILARERAARNDERKEDDARTARIVHHVSELEKRQKISPTLEDEWQKASAAPASSPAAANHAPTPVAPPAAAVEKGGATSPAVQTKPAVAPEKPVAVPSKPVSTPAAAPAKHPPAAPAKLSPQVSTLKEAIEQMNATSPKKH